MTPMQTAAPIARIRAAEGERPESERLFTDPYAHLFADAAPDVVAFFSMIPFFEEHVRLRTRFFDDAVRRALESGIREIVLVGAGFDSRALRLPEIAAAGARVIEVDHAEQLAEKRRRLEGAGVTIPPHSIHAPANLQTAGELERALRAALVAPGAPILWVCEGLFGYLTPAELRALAASIAGLSGPTSKVVANYSGSSLPPELVAHAFASAGFRVGAAPSYGDLHRVHLRSEPTAGHEAFAFFEAAR